jgi:hypothetical protein
MIREVLDQVVDGHLELSEVENVTCSGALCHGCKLSCGSGHWFDPIRNGHPRRQCIHSTSTVSAFFSMTLTCSLVCKKEGGLAETTAEALSAPETGRDHDSGDMHRNTYFDTPTATHCVRISYGVLTCYRNSRAGGRRRRIEEAYCYGEG